MMVSCTPGNPGEKVTEKLVKLWEKGYKLP